MEFCIEENKKSEEIILSPFGEYNIVITTYKTKGGCWDTYRYQVRSDEKIIKTVYSTSCKKLYKFFRRYDHECLFITTSSYTQKFIDLVTLEEYDSNPNNKFCWVKIDPNPSGSILAVTGCYWSSLDEVRFIPFDNPNDGWDNYIDIVDDADIKWIDDYTASVEEVKYSSDGGSDKDEVYTYILKIQNGKISTS